MRATPHFDRFAADIFRALGNPNNAAVEIYYSGSGDSGWFDPGYAVRYNGILIQSGEIKTGSVFPLLNREQIAALQAVDGAVNESLLHQELFHILEDNAPGWEINSGASGFFRIDTTGKRVHTHNQYYEDCDTTVEAF